LGGALVESSAAPVVEMNANAVKMRTPLMPNIKTREYLIYHPQY
jgi:hypothetical protein